jgi:hypothetical protein
MASRESQGLQVALILFVMITVVLAVTTYLYFRKSEEKIRQADVAVKEAKDAKANEASMQFKLQLLKHMLGYDRKTDPELVSIKAGIGADPQMEEIMANYDQDIAMYGGGLPGQNLDYRSLPGILISTINDRNKNLADASTSHEKLVTEHKAELDEQKQLAASAVKVRDDKVAELEQERLKFNTDRTRITQENQRVASVLPARQKEFEQTTGAMQEKIAELTRARINLINQNDILREQRAKETQTTYERPAGEIVLVNSAANTVWINLGLADGLQRQMTFSVFDKNATGLVEENIKGRIEVTKVTEPHRAEARILEDVMTDPILRNDKIYSPSFKKGQKTRFALAGVLDIDGDGKSDQNKVKSLITLNGGEVDAELLEDGSIAGEMTNETRYIVKGEIPDERDAKAFLDGFTRMTEKASELGVTSISVDRLLDFMGYRPDNPVEQLDRGGSGGQREQETFRKRTPASVP